MSAIASQITGVSTVCSTVVSGTDQRKNLKVRVTGICARNSPVTDEFSAQKASNAENVSFWWRHHENDAISFLDRFLRQKSLGMICNINHSDYPMKLMIRFKLFVISTAEYCDILFYGDYLKTYVSSDI